ncbi:MAG: succinate dehydrogenase flavoprotein subunit, partial [Phycisphaeraceae bacterium]|nr:succinate dehydrogenase flavoprotein subunit [Phycisphaeraceae bacterium]
MADQPRVIVVGGGLSGLAASVRIAESGLDVDLFSMVPVKRSHSVCAQGGINAANEVARQQGYSEWMHMDETLYGGDFINHQPPVYEMTHWAPKIIDLMDRMGVPFNRTAEGRRDLRLFGGSLYKRTHFAGATTGQQLMYALDEQTRRWEVEGKVTKYEFWEFLWPVLDDDGNCKGIVAQDMRSMELKAFRADAVVMATGGCGLIFGKSTNSTICTGGAASRCYQAGAWLGNPEFIQVHPTAIPGADKCRLMSESARGEGGRVWVPRDKDDSRPAETIPEEDRWYFLEDRYPKYGNLVPRDIATREIFEVCQEGHGIGGGRMVYLDVTHLPAETKDKLAGILEIYEKFTGDDPREKPMKIFPAVHYTMGGLYTTYEQQEKEPIAGDGDVAIGLDPEAPGNMMTNIPGLYAFGEVNYQYHGGTRLGANALLNCIFDGLFCGKGVVNYVQDEVKTRAADVADSCFDRIIDQEQTRMDKLVNNEGEFNPYEIHQRLGDELTDTCTVVREGGKMEKTYESLREMKEQAKDMRLSDTGVWTNQNLSFARALRDMLIYGEAILAASIDRTESRGSHYRPDYPDRNDEKFLKTTIAKYDADNDRPILEYEPVPQPMVEPRARTYGKVEDDAGD